MLFHLANLPYWLLLGMGVCLFLLVIFSGGGDDELDADGDADSSSHDFDSDANGDFSVVQIMGWFGFGKAPLILLLATDLSFWGVFGWMLNAALGEIFGSVPSGFWGGVIFVGSMGLALLAGGLLARPVGRALASFGEDVSSDRLIGCIGTVSSGVIPPYKVGRIGQVNVIDPARNLVSVNATLPEWATLVPQIGEKVLVIDRLAQTYLVVLKDSPDQDYWLNGPSNKQDTH